MSKPIAIGGDVFGGPFSHGIRKAGFDVPLHVEHGNYGVNMALLNFRGLEVRCGEENWRKGKIGAPPALLFCNPPCAPWSAAGVKKGIDNAKRYLDDERADCSGRLLQFALDIKAKTFIWESVVRAWTAGTDLVLAHARRCRDAGYAVTVLLQNNMHLGAPQSRKRMLFIAHKHPLVYPKFTEPRTIKEWLKGVPPGDLSETGIHKGWEWLWAQQSPDMRRAYMMASASKQKWVEKNGGKISFLFKRPKNDRPPPVLLASILHPDKPRYLSWNEFRVLNGLPLTWQKPDGMSLQAGGTMLSRAVLSGVGTWVGKAVKKGLTQPALTKRQREYILLDVRKPDEQRREWLLP